MEKKSFLNKIMIKEEIEDKELLETLLTQAAERKVEIKHLKKVKN